MTFAFIQATIFSATVRVTDLKAAPIPPPMCHYELNFPNTVCEVAQLDGQAAFLLADQSLYLCKELIHSLFIIIRVKQMIALYRVR